MVKATHKKRKVRMNHLKNIIDGMGQALVLSPKNDYVRPSSEGFRADSKALKGDASAVAKDLRDVLSKKQYGK